MSDIIRVLESKTAAGIRNVPLSAMCKSELLRWRSLVGPRFSPHVFPNMRNPERPLKQIRGSWAKALKLANVNHFWIYNLRHTFAKKFFNLLWQRIPVLVAVIVQKRHFSIGNLQKLIHEGAVLQTPLLVFTQLAFLHFTQEAVMRFVVCFLHTCLFHLYAFLFHLQAFLFSLTDTFLMCLAKPTCFLTAIEAYRDGNREPPKKSLPIVPACNQIADRL